MSVDDCEKITDDEAIAIDEKDAPGNKSPGVFSMPCEENARLEADVPPDAESPAAEDPTDAAGGAHDGGEKVEQKPKPPVFTPKMLLMLILPLVLEQLLAVTVGMADTIMVTSVGTPIESSAAVSAISLVDTITTLIIQVFGALATGGAIVAAQFLGKGDDKDACRSAKQLILISLVAGLVIMAVALIFNGGLIHALFGDLDELTDSNAHIYFLLSACSYPFLALLNACAALFRSMRNPKISLLTSAIMNAINIGGNAWLIYGMKMGVKGAGIASLVSRAVAAAIMFILLFDKKRLIHLDDFFPKFDKSIVKKIVVVGVPTGIEGGLFQAGKLIVAGLVATMGTVSIAANGISNTLTNFAIIPGAAIGLAAVTVVGQCCGAEAYDDAKRYTLKLMLIAFISNAALSLALFLSAPALFNAFNLPEQSLDTAENIVRLFCIVMAAIWVPSFLLPNGLRAAGDVKFAMIVSALSMLILRIGAAYLLAYVAGLGVMSVWIAMYMDWGARTVCFLVRFFTGGWKNKRVV